MSSTVSDPALGVVLDGRYRVVRRLASGGMSRVYIGHDERLDRPVAIKIMHTDLAEDPPFIARFGREARAAARLLHPNIVTVHDQGSDPAHHAVYLVMELVRGSTLRDLLHARRSLTYAEALAVIEPVLTGLAIAHREGLVHRDIKPENILIDVDGRVLVADFGLARAVAESSHTTHAGRAGAVFGTVAYLAPEQVSQGYADARSDVYAVGVMLYELLTGRPPYVGDNAVSVAYRHVNDDVPPPSDEVAGLPGVLDDLVIAATTRNPLQRPADAGAMLEGVRAARVALDVRDTPVPEVLLPPALLGEQPGSGPAGELSAVSSTAATASLAAGAETATRIEPGDRTLVHPPQTHPPERDVAGPAAATPVIALGGDVDSDADRPGRSASATDGTTGRRRSRRWLAPLAATVVILMLAGAGFWWLQYGRWTTVPDFTAARGQEEIASIAQQAGVTVRLQEGQFSETKATDYVISADPPAGRRVLRGDEVSIVLSKGPERYTVATSRLGRPAEEVLAALTEEFGDKITITTTNQHDEQVPKGSVVAFSPPAGTNMQPGDSLVVIVSDGMAPIPLPDVAGQSPEAATTALTSAGFAPAVSPAQEFSDAEAGKVARTDPPAGTSVQPGAGVQVSIVVSKGPDLVEVPAVIGMTTTSATQTLEAAGFEVERSTLFLSLGLVANQSPNGGTMAKRGSTVTITIV